jgi:DNA-binding CsgD family transcriptional regulator
MIIAHEMGRYHIGDSLYMERDRVMPFEWVDDTTFITTFEGYKELMVRSSTMTEERMEEIRQLVRQHPNDADSPVKHFVLSTTERKLKAKNRIFLYIIIGMGIVAAGVAIYVWQLRKRKREVERKLAEIEEEHTLRPALVADAMKQVETEFFHSDYYLSLRHRIEQGENIRPEEWKQLEQRLKSIYPRFSSSLYGLYNLSPTEYQVCILTKIRTTPKEIADVLCKDKSTISSIRKRLYKKVFGREGSGKEWDEFILSL